mmetsp:Transcript_19185/g.33708  ORF Transcript_19185/g.33708 Transcript_19185/m.33708 type:complete len:91 (+) Transcript_19185:66-338(+)
MNKAIRVAIVVSIPISDDEMAIVYHSGVGGCIAAMTNERPAWRAWNPFTPRKKNILMFRRMSPEHSMSLRRYPSTKAAPRHHFRRRRPWL